MNESNHNFVWASRDVAREGDRLRVRNLAPAPGFGRRAGRMTEVKEAPAGRFADDVGEHVEGRRSGSTAPMVGQADAITGAGCKLSRFDFEESDVVHFAIN